MTAISFDEFLEKDCPTDADWSVEEAKSLSIRDIGDWSDTVTIMPQESIRSDASTGEHSYLGLVDFLQYIEPIQAGLMWSQNKWSRRLGFVQRRTEIWRMVVTQTSYLDPTAFTLSTPRGFSSYTLTPALPKRPPDWCIPLQQIYISPLAITPELANETSATLSPADVVYKLNTILGTQKVLDTELESCIGRCIERKWDLGTIYGHLRLWWRLEDNFGGGMRQIEVRKEEWDLKFDVPDSQLTIPNPETFPPRRVWDLYSNRVLPSYLLFTGDRYPISSQIWAVSHCWVPDLDRQAVWTSINGYEWPVPIPVDTTLDHVRIELLNMGAEYVFLDVLCLRQPGDPAKEPLRREEWKVDVPTLMNVYRRRRDQTTVVYFNGLGLPLDMSGSKLDSPFHWFQRSWTLQETTDKWLPGGLVHPIPGGSSNGHRFVDLMRRSIEAVQPENRTFMDLVYAFQDRPGVAEKKGHDRVAALSYLLSSSLRLQYDNELSTADDLWQMLKKELLSKFSTTSMHLLDLLVRCPSADPNHWIPPWQLLISTVEHIPKPSLGYCESDLLMTSKDPRAQCESPAIDYIFHDGYVLNDRYKTCATDLRKIEIRTPWSAKTFVVNTFADLPTDEEVTLVGLANFECWIIGKIMGTRLISGLNSPTVGYAILFKKLTVGRITSPEARYELSQLELGGHYFVAYWTAEMSYRPIRYFDTTRANMRQGRRDEAKRDNVVKNYLKWRDAMDEQKDI